MYYKMSLFLARYKKYVSPLFNPQHENGCVHYYFFGLTEYGASQKGLCPLVLVRLRQTLSRLGNLKHRFIAIGLPKTYSFVE